MSAPTALVLYQSGAGGRIGGGGARARVRPYVCRARGQGIVALLATVNRWTQPCTIAPGGAPMAAVPVSRGTGIATKCCARQTRLTLLFVFACVAFFAPDSMERHTWTPSGVAVARAT